MTPTFCRLPSLIARAAAALAAAILVASCGGGVSANPSPIVDSPTLTILPASATLYSGMPTTFVLSGGTGAYIVTSDNQAIVPISGGVTGRSVTVVPNPVTADTTVTLTLRDTGSAAPVTATLTVRPGTVTNNVSITPNPLQSSSCSPAVCSGGDAEVRATLSQGGIPLAARGVRFEVMSGDFRFIVTPAGVAPEQTALSVAVATDETGIARARIRATALAPNQTALLRVTDMGSGAYRQTSFAIAQFTGNTPSFFTLPSAITFTGPYTNVCAADAVTLVSIFGGVPPYTVAAALSGFNVTPTVVAASGGSFEVRLGSAPVCLSSVPIGVTDSTGHTITVTLSSVAGTGTAPPPPIALFPGTLGLLCSFNIVNPTPPPATTEVAVTSSVSITGGSGTFSASTDHPRVSVTVSDRTVTLQRRSGDGTATYPTSGVLTVTDGNTVATTTFSVPANCPGGAPTSSLAVTPSSATVDGTDGNPGVNLLISGGAGTYSVAFIADPRIRATITGSTLNIDTATSCTAPSTALSSYVNITDGISILSVPVSATVCGSAPTPPTTFTVSPSSVTVAGATGNLGANVLLSGGSGSYTVTFVSDPRITASVSSSTLNIRTTTTCAAPTIPLAANVNVSDGTTTQSVSVNATVCP